MRVRAPSLFSLVLVVSHALATPVASQTPDGPPVRIWLGSSPTIVSGNLERVYVQTTSDGHLVVLHARPDGRVEVLFPEDPARDPFVRAGTYEINTPVSSGPAGRGMVVAALSPDPIWFDEFVHRSEWDAAALTAGGAGDDPEAVLTDIVQRMLGDGSFNYDVATYTVAARSVATVDAVSDTTQPQSVCIDCAVTTVDLVVTDLPLRHFAHRHRRVSAAPAAAPAPPAPAAIAVYSVHQPSALEPLPLRAPRPVSASNPRHRVPEPAPAAVRAVPLVARARSAAARAAEMPRSQLLTRGAHVERTPGSDLVPANTPARSWVPAVSAASAPAPAARGATPAPVAAPEPRVVARPDPRAGVARAGTGTPEAAPAPARAGSATGVGLGQVHTAGWRH